MIEKNQKNVLGEPLEICGCKPMTGFFRTGKCETGNEDESAHLVCAVMDDDFLAFSASRGNDLSKPRDEFHFPGLVEGDSWCLCALRWLEAYKVGVAPRVKLLSTHEKVTEYVPLEYLKAFAADLV